jgi:hypothetical protein
MGISVGLSLDLSSATINTVETPITSTSLFGEKVIGITATLVNAGTTDLVGRKSVTLQNNSSNSIYVSNVDTVSITNGLYCAAGAVLTLPLNALVPLPIYAISIGLASNVSIMEV